MKTLKLLFLGLILAAFTMPQEVNGQAVINEYTFDVYYGGYNYNCTDGELLTGELFYKEVINKSIISWKIKGDLIGERTGMVYKAQENGSYNLKKGENYKFHVRILREDGKIFDITMVKDFDKITIKCFDE